MKSRSSLKTPFFPDDFLDDFLIKERGIPCFFAFLPRLISS